MNRCRGNKNVNDFLLLLFLISAFHQNCVAVVVIAACSSTTTTTKNQEREREKNRNSPMRTLHTKRSMYECDYGYIYEIVILKELCH